MKEATRSVQSVERNLAAISAPAQQGAVQAGLVAIIGSMNADYTVEVEQMPQPGETIKGGAMVIHPGGKSANQASSCAHLGQETRMLGAVGSDSNADFLIDQLAGAGVDTTGIERVDGPSGSTIIVVDAAGENFIVVSAGSNGQVTPEYAQRHENTIASAAVLGVCLETPVETVTAAAQIAQKAGTTVVLNISPLPDRVPSELIAATDIVMMNEHETSDFLGLGVDLTLESDWEAVQRKLAERGFARAVITLGAAGSVVLDGGAGGSGGGSSDSDGSDTPGGGSGAPSVADVSGTSGSTPSGPVHIPAYTVKPIDTTGAGDSFMGATLAGLASGLSLVEACSTASAVSAYSTLAKGAQSSYGSSAQILDFVRSR